MRRLVLLQGIIGGYGRSDEAAIIRALAELAGVRRETLLAVGQTRRRQADALAANVAKLKAEGLTAGQIAIRVHRSESRVRALLARSKRHTV
jgi:DNA-binding CsgD family transcriptional regulator